MRKPLSYEEVLHTLKLLHEITTNPLSDAHALRQAAKVHAHSAEHHALCVMNLIENAEEADANSKMGEKKRKDG